MTAVQDVLLNYTGYQLGLGVQHKILTMVHNCLNQRAPDYLSNLLTYRSEIRPITCRRLRSELNYRLLQVPRKKLKTFVARSFRVTGLTLWKKYT